MAKSLHPIARRLNLRHRRNERAIKLGIGKTGKENRPPHVWITVRELETVIHAMNMR